MLVEITCPTCKKLFVPKKIGKKYCTHVCFAKRFGDVEIICETCNRHFSVSYRFRTQKTCGRACMGGAQGYKARRREKIKKSCLACNKEFDVNKSYINAKYCSYLCFHDHHYGKHDNIVILSCEACQNQFSVGYYKRKKRFCSRKCSTSGKMNGMYGKPGPMLDKIAWNRGLTKDTDARLSIAGKKISSLMKTKFKTGILSNAGNANPMYGHISSTLTPEQRQRYSEAAIKRVLLGQSGYKTGHLTGIYNGVKCDKPVKFKSSWELAVMMWWDECEDVITYTYEPITVKLLNGRRTLPDFIVRRIGREDAVVEIKPTAIQKLITIKEKLELTKLAVETMGYNYEIIGNYEIDVMRTSLGEVFKNAVKLYKNRK